MGTIERKTLTNNNKERSGRLVLHLHRVKNNTMGTFSSNYFESSIKRLVMASFVFVLLLPIAFFVYSFFENSWQKVEQRMVEKHHLISEALVEPFSLFFSTRQQILNTLGQELINLDSEKQNVQSTLDKHLNSFGNFVSLSYTSNPNAVITHVASKNTQKLDLVNLDYSELSLAELPVVEKKSGGKFFLSPIFRSSINNNPVILVKHLIFDKSQRPKGLILAEISLDEIGRICSKINFGVKGHCAVVDNAGHVVAHPNKAWVQSIRDLSRLSVVKKMLSGKSGTTEFYSPFLKADMVAGFSPIPTLGWGVMIPQPKSELTKAFASTRYHTTIWLLIGVLVALIVSVLLTQKIIQPINTLNRLTHEFDQFRDYDSINIGVPPANTPAEINTLWTSFSNLLSGLQYSNKEMKQATAKLKKMNKHLYKISTQDDLTSLSNRRYFTQTLNKVLRNEFATNVGIIMIDIDKFKHLNDTYGHETGDLAIKHLAGILKKSTRSCDLVARLGGDEFIVYIQNPTDFVLSKLAEMIPSNLEKKPLVLNNKTLPFTLSLGTVNRLNDGTLSTTELLHCADIAMYNSKLSGRNRVSAYQPEATTA